MDALNVSEKIVTANTQIISLIDRYKNGDTASLKKQDMTQLFESISSVVDSNFGKNKDHVKQFLFSYLRLLNKVICTNTDIFKIHLELENQISYLRNFITDEINNVERNALGISNV
ncbi:MAG: hypothetical protein V4654_13385 [Bdellovibrionota bacterium]